ncbi:MAG: D-alanine--D-alanine ligase [Candidatus Marinimicrobia bacterium]|nr:D-alanine--D-alanine ligase [Candidatus Neomarinimicrobiota bacterium]|tara:strand:- start:2209 stop:3168 length:960 start_codon:yes stop_codon:yes gene_type:complete
MEDYSVLKEKNIMVLAGGWSAEREISLKSGLAVSKALEELHFNYNFKDLHSKIEVENLSSDIDLVFIALHGRGGEDGYIQRILEDKGIMYTGSNPESCEIAMDKSETKKIWRDLLLPTPDFVEIKKAGTPEMKLTPFLSEEKDITALDQSFVVKPSREGSSYGISIVKPGKGSLEDSMREAIKFDETLIVEAFVPGRELTVSILGQKVLHPIHIKPSGSFYDFKSKYESNTTEYLKAKLSRNKLQEIKEIAWHAFSSLGCEGWGRVDFIQDEKDNFQLIEVNTIPGLTETSLFPKAASFEGISFKDVIAKILFLACKDH